MRVLLVSVHALRVKDEGLTPTLVALLCEESIEIHGQLTDDGRRQVVETAESVLRGPDRAWLVFDGVLPMGFQLAADGASRRWFRPGQRTPQAEKALPEVE